MRKRLSVLVVALIAIAGPAAADPDKSKELIQGILDRMAIALKTHGELKWEDLQASPASAGDLVVVPNLRYQGGDGVAELGRVEFTVSDAPPAGDGSARQRIAMKLGGKITVTTQNDPPVDITFEDHGFAGTWLPELETLTAAEFSYRNIRAADRVGNGEVKIGELLLESKLTDDGQLWTGAMRFAMKRLSASSKGTVIAVDEIAEIVSAEKLPLAQFSEFNKKFREIIGNRPANELTSDDWQPVMELMRGLSLGDAMRLEFTLAGIDVRGPDGSGKLGKAGLGFGVKRAAPENADVALDLSVDGLDVPVPTMPELVPNRGRVDVKVLGLPAARLWDAVIEAAREGTASGPDAGKQMLMGQILEIAHSTDAGLKVGLALGAPALSGDASSDFKFDPDAAQMLFGQARLTVLGLDPMLEKIRKGSQTEQTQQAMAVLSMLKGFGRTEIANNQIVYLYDFVLDKSGEMTINGQDLQTLMNQNQGGQKGQGGQRPPPKRRS
jgi:hypothetical protein